MSLEHDQEISVNLECTEKYKKAVRDLINGG